MGHPYHHAVSSAKKFGGKPEDYQRIHDWFDRSKEFLADFRHRAVSHHAQGIFECERLFGTTIKNSDGREIPTRLIGEQHVKEDLGFIPTLEAWLGCIGQKPWMIRGTLPLAETLSNISVSDLSGGYTVGDKIKIVTTPHEEQNWNGAISPISSHNQ